MRTKELIVITVMVTALAGCSKAGGTSPAAGVKADNTTTGGTRTVDVCSLLTTAEATAVLGEPAKDGVPHAYQSTRQCQWDSANGSVAILVWIGDQKDTWQSTRDTSKRAPKFSDVSGLGDAAFTTGFDLHILKGDDMYQIGVSGPFQDHVQRATTVAKEALARA